MGLVRTPGFSSAGSVCCSGEAQEALCDVYLPQPPGPLGLFVPTQRKEDLTGSLAGVGVLARTHGGPSLCGSHGPGTHACMCCMLAALTGSCFLSLMKLFVFIFHATRMK